MKINIKQQHSDVFTDLIYVYMKQQIIMRQRS